MGETQGILLRLFVVYTMSGCKNNIFHIHLHLTLFLYITPGENIWLAVGDKEWGTWLWI